MYSPDQGSALVHSGDLRHGGVDITSGERILLVGFVGVDAQPYSARAAGAAAYEGFCKFGNAAWDRTATGSD